MKKIFLLFTFLFIAKTNFAQLNWAPIANGGFNTGGTNIQFLQKHGPYMFSGVYNPLAGKIQAYYAAMDTVNSFLPIPFTTLDMAGDTAITSVASTQSGGGYLYLGTSSATGLGGNVYGTPDNGASWSKVFSNANGLGNNYSVGTVTTTKSNGTDSLLVSVHRPYMGTVNTNLTGNTTVTTVAGNFFDSGGPGGVYNNYEDYTITFYPETNGNFVQLNFSSFSSETNYDYLYIYDGINTGAPQMAVLNGFPVMPATYTATNPQGAITVYWHSDVSATYQGWQATITNIDNLSNVIPQIPNVTHFFKAPLNAANNSSWTESDTIAEHIVDVATFNNRVYALGIGGNLFCKNNLNASWFNMGNMPGYTGTYSSLDVFNNKLLMSAENAGGAMLWAFDTTLSFINVTTNAFYEYGSCQRFASSKVTANAIYFVGNEAPSKIWKSTDGINYYTISNNGMSGENNGIGAYVDEFLGNAIASGYAVGNAGGAQVWIACLPPSANFTYGNTTILCVGDSRTFTAAGGAVNYKWYVNDSLYLSGTDTVFTPSGIFNTPGYINVSLTTAGPVCGDSVGVQFYVNSLPTNDPLTFYDTTICANSLISIDIDFGQGGGLRTNGGTSMHAFDMAGNNLGYLSYYVTPTDTVTYLVAAIDYNGCKAPYDTVTINTFALPNVQIVSVGVDFCAGDSIQLIATGGEYYTWGNGGPISDTIYENNSNTWILNGTDNNYCENTDTISVVMHDNPIVNVGPDVVICEGQSINLNAASIGGISGSWAPATGLSSAVTSATNAGPDTTTTYIFTSVTAYNCKSTDTITVAVNPYPAPSIIGADTVCNGATNVVYSTAVVAGNTDTWTVNGGVIVSGQGTQSITVNWINPSVASISCLETNTVTGCTGTASKNITINSVLPIITASTSVCAGSLNEVASVNALVGSTYAWTVNGGAIAAGQGTDSISINWGMGSFAVISLTQTSLEGCVGTATKNITLNSPTISISPTSTVCSGSTNVTYAVANNAGSTYTWAVSGGTIVSGQNTSTLIVNWSYGAIGNVSVTETNVMGCTASSSVNITLTTPTVAITPTTAQCAGATNVVYAVANNAGSTYSWTIAGGTIVSGQGSDSVIVNWANGTIGNVTATETNASGCTASSSANITLNAPIVTITPTTAVCAGSTNVVYAVTNNAGSTYNWTIGGGTIVSGQSTNSVTVNWGTNAFGNLIATETNTSGCTGMASVNISLTAPIPVITPTSAACSGATGIVYTTTLNAGSSYSWTIAGGTITAGQNTNSITVDWNNGVLGNLAVSETSAGGCTGSSSANITLTAPIVSAGSDVSICSGSNTTLNGSATGAGPLTYVWTPSTTLSSAVIANPVATPTINTTYTLTATDVNGCSSSDAVTVSLNSIYSTFTGNVQYDSLGTIKVVRAGTVKAFSADSAGLIYPVSVAYISSNGTFSLYGIPAGNYKIFIEPNSNIYPYLSNIYYNGANLWEDANSIAFSCGNTINQTINLPDYVAPILGNASISGRILADANYQGKTNVQGDPIPGVDVALEQNPGSVMLTTTTTNNSGYFAFFNLAPNVAGTWYTLLVNIPGYGLDSTYEHIVIGNNQASVHNDYLVGDSVIYIDSALSATLNGVKSIVKSDLVANFQSYPNPYSLETTINYSIVSDAVVKLDVYNALGQRVESIVNTNQATGNYKYTFGAKSTGVYYVRLVVNDKVSVLKLVEM